MSWQGRAYSIKVLQEDVDPGYPYPVSRYRISLQSAVVSPGTCSLTPRTVDLTSSMSEPRIAIAASAEGLVVAYSFDEYTQFVGSRYLLRIHRLNPSTLGSVRVAGLEGHFVSETGGWGAPAPISLDRLTLYPGSLEVSGSLEGDTNSITEDPATAPWPYPIAQGSHFVAIYPDFFGATQQPPQLVTY